MKGKKRKGRTTTLWWHICKYDVFKFLGLSVGECDVCGERQEGRSAGANLSRVCS
jgi:hypothetical protein